MSKMYYLYPVISLAAFTTLVHEQWATLAPQQDTNPYFMSEIMIPYASANYAMSGFIDY